MDITSTTGIRGKPGAVRKGHQVPRERFSTLLDAKLDIAATNTDSKNATILSTSVQEPGFVLVGEISKKNPTVSHLLIDHHDYRNSCWKIIHSDQNRDKPFTKIEEGTKIYIQKSDFSLLWDNDSARPHPKTETEPALVAVDQPTDATHIRKQDSFSEKLINAVKQNLGMAYDQINCYELIVQGLRNLGYRYGGYGGLKESLISMAQSRGEAINTYLSGEGLLEASGSGRYVKTVTPVSDYQGNTDEILDDILPVIQPGQILSFSTPSRGHTGIVSRREGQWTYVNSGILDHSIGPRGPRKGVGEESLALEILNWVKLAARKNEPLSLTLGHLDEQKLEKYKTIPWDV